MLRAVFRYLRQKLSNRPSSNVLEGVKKEVKASSAVNVSSIAAPIYTEVQMRSAIARLAFHFGDELLSIWRAAEGASSSPPSFSELSDSLEHFVKKNVPKIADRIDFMGSVSDLGDKLASDKVVLKALFDVELPRILRVESEKAYLMADARRQREEARRVFLTQIDKKLDVHGAALARNLRAAYVHDEYGALVLDERDEEIFRFLNSVRLLDGANEYGMGQVRKYIKNWSAKQRKILETSNLPPNNGHDFEHWVAAHLSKAGWNATVTQASSDDGVDVIAERDGISVAVQCKRYAGSVGNKAVQEVFSGMKHVQLDRAVVISTGKYTKAAQGLASTTGVLLLSEQDIQHMWELLNR